MATQAFMEKDFSEFMTIDQLDSCLYFLGQFWVYKLFHSPLILTAVFNQLKIQQSDRMASDELYLVQGDHSLMFVF